MVMSSPGSNKFPVASLAQAPQMPPRFEGDHRSPVSTTHLRTNRLCSTVGEVLPPPPGHDATKRPKHPARDRFNEISERPSEPSQLITAAPGGTPQPSPSGSALRVTSEPKARQELASAVPRLPRPTNTCALMRGLTSSNARLHARDYHILVVVTVDFRQAVRDRRRGCTRRMHPDMRR